MIWVVAMFALGLFLSAFFSGSETGFYRATRVRLVLDAVGGNLVARGLLGLTNNPTLFVATTLIGNNVANYLTSLAVVLAARLMFTSHAGFVELVGPVVMTPVVFVYGELLPKDLFYKAPNRLLRLGGPLFLLCVVLFSPVSALLWAMGRCLQWLVGESPETVRALLARQELQGVFDEGQEAGLLRPAQRALATRLFATSSQPVTDFCHPVSRAPLLKLGQSKEQILAQARRQRFSSALVAGDQRRKEYLGYVKIVDLYLDPSPTLDPEHLRPLPDVSSSETHGAVLLRMQSARESMVRVVDSQGKSVGLLTNHDLTRPLLQPKGV